MTNRILLIALALYGASAGAQTVWRCGNSYGQQPCAGGSPVAVSEPVSGKPVANTDAKLAAELEKARLAQERNAPKAIVIGPVQAPPLRESAQDGTKAKVGKLEQFTAVSPASPKAKKPKSKKKKT